MTRDEIEAGWPLAVRHRVAVVRFLETAGTTASARRRKVSRRQVINGYDETHDIPQLAARIGLSPGGTAAVLARAIRVARGFESGTLRQPKPRKNFTLTLTNPPAALIKDIDAWAKMRGESRREAACELMKIGLDVTSARVEKHRASVSSDSIDKERAQRLVGYVRAPPDEPRQQIGFCGARQIREPRR